LIRRLRRRNGSGWMRIRASRFRAEWMILALLSGMGEYTARFRAGETEFALRMPIGAFISEFARRKGTVKNMMFKK